MYLQWPVANFRQISRMDGKRQKGKMSKTRIFNIEVEGEEIRTHVQQFFQQLFVTFHMIYFYFQSCKKLKRFSPSFLKQHFAYT
jgi:hypothetical protein